MGDVIELTRTEPRRQAVRHQDAARELRFLMDVVGASCQVHRHGQSFHRVWITPDEVSRLRSVACRETGDLD